MKLEGIELRRIGLPGVPVQIGTGPGVRIIDRHATLATVAVAEIAALSMHGLANGALAYKVTILEKLERGQLVSAEASREMIAILKRCRDAYGIRRRLSGIPVANKTGALDALRSDVGIVYSKGGRIAMAITVDAMPSAGYTPDNPGCLLIADLAKLLVDGLAR